MQATGKGATLGGDPAANPNRELARCPRPFWPSTWANTRAWPASTVPAPTRLSPPWHPIPRRCCGWRPGTSLTWWLSRDPHRGSTRLGRLPCPVLAAHQRQEALKCETCVKSGKIPRLADPDPPSRDDYTTEG